MKTLKLLCITLFFITGTAIAESDQHGHDHSEKPTADEQEHSDKHDDKKDEHGEERQEEEGGVELNDKQAKEIGLEVKTIHSESHMNEVKISGEVKLNEYQTAKVTNRISAQVVKRHVKIGEHVKNGQALVTLSSVEMAEAQGELLSTYQEWQRVKALGKKVVSDKRFNEAKIAYQQAVAKTKAYGMSETQVNELVKNSDLSKATGSFVLSAPREGTIIKDHFIEGEYLEPGHVLFEVTDESTVWVEARAAIADVHAVKENTPARIKVNSHWLSGTVSQVLHTIDETTRTRAVRLVVENQNHQLHPGQFVDVYLPTGSQSKGVKLPLTAVLRDEHGDWFVFVKAGEHDFKKQEVELVQSTKEFAVVNGLSDKTAVVTKGSFFLQSELAKGGFEVHNH